jgi:hypothetical protein
MGVQQAIDEKGSCIKIHCSSMTKSKGHINNDNRRTGADTACKIIVNKH